jgi:hypothetical protein
MLRLHHQIAGKSRLFGVFVVVPGDWNGVGIRLRAIEIDIAANAAVSFRP